MDPQEHAMQELLRKSLRDIQVETAYIWAYRSQAARRLAKSARASGAEADAHAWLLDGQEYEHEALEHAALAGDNVLSAVRLIVGS